MSDEWISVLQTAVQATKARGMTCDMIVGSGWPYGAESLARADQTQMMALGTRNLTGSQHLTVKTADLLHEVSPRFVSAYRDPLKELISVLLVLAQVDQATASVPVPIDPNRETISLDVPAGDHVLYFLVKLTGFMAVINGAPGASGPVLNHFRASSVQGYLDRISDRLSAKLGPLSDHFRAFFTDSIELEGENWCDDMLAEFHRRRGYDLAPFLPFVLFKVGEMGNAVSAPYGATFTPAFKKQTELVRYDFERTKRELFLERFVATFVSWCHKNGVKSRMQAYGMECDPIAAGMMLDIPECETWIRTEQILPFGDGDYDHGRSYTMVNKFVSSAAHLAGKQLISCEEMTNTDDPFHASLERIKVAGDQSMLSGVTQSVLHGFNYSPLAAPFPGWVRYGTFFNERNTWWPYFKLWTDYKARLSALVQHAEMQADIAILPPEADLASKYGFQRDPFPRTAYPGYLFKLWEVIQQNGSGCDYLNETIINQSTIEHGRITFRTRSYKAIVLPEVESLHPATAKQLQAFVATGGTILFLGKTPHLAAGLAHNTEESSEVARIFTDMRARYTSLTPLETVDEHNMVDWYRSLQQRHSLRPTVEISAPRDFISQIHYRTAGQEIFFFSHNGPQDRHTFEATFRINQKQAWLWNPETGSRSSLPLTGSGPTLHLSLGPSESQLIVFGSAPPSHAAETTSTSMLGSEPAHVIDIDGPWHLQLTSVDGTTNSVELPNATDLDQLPAYQSFAGTLAYRKQFTVNATPLPNRLTLGRPHAVTEVELNGKPLGVRWYGEHVYDLSHALVLGPNQLTIKVTTTLGNYLKSLKENRTAQAWAADTPSVPVGLTHPVQLLTVR